MNLAYIDLVEAFKGAVKHVLKHDHEVDYSELANEVDCGDVAQHIDLCDLANNICLSELTDHIEIDDRIYSAVNDNLPDSVSMWFRDNESDMECAVRDAVAWYFETRPTPLRRFRSACKRR